MPPHSLTPPSPPSIEPRVSAMIDLIASLPHLHDPREALDPLLATLRPGIGSRAVVRISTASLPPNHACVLNVHHVDSPAAGSVSTAPASPFSPLTTTSSTLAAILRTPSPKIIHHLPPETSDLPAPLRLYQSAIAAPLFVDGHATDWALLFDSRPEAFGVEDLEELVLRASLVCSFINNLAITQQLCSANLKVRKEIDQIAAIQRALLPNDLPHIPGLEVAAHYAPVLDAGGDLYDVIEYRDPAPSGPHSTGVAASATAGSPNGSPPAAPRYAFLIGDVCGHGAPAAVVMAMVHSILHAYPKRPEGPAELLHHVNHHLCNKKIGRAFVTAFLALYNPATRELTYTRAGHNPPLLHDPASNAVTRLEEIGDMPLGIDPDATFTEATFTLSPGQTLLLYTDGLTESANPAGVFFDLPNLERLLLHHPPTAPVQTLIDALQSAVRAHEDTGPQVDDQTLVAIRAA